MDPWTYINISPTGDQLATGAWTPQVYGDGQRTLRGSEKSHLTWQRNPNQFTLNKPASVKMLNITGIWTPYFWRNGSEKQQITMFENPINNI